MTTHLYISDEQPRACVLCGIVKRPTEFYRRETGRLRRECKKCQLARHDPSSPAAIRAKKRWQAQNPEKRAAHIAVGNAIANGELEKPSICSRCEMAYHVIHAHHMDYTRPLDVLWLCPKCHAEEHN